MKITSLVAATAAVVTLGACSAAPVGLESTTAAPSFELSNTLSATSTFLIGVDSTAIVQSTAPATCTTSTTTSTPTTTTTSTSTSTTQLSASGTYAVAYGSTLLPSCPTAP